MEPWEWAIVGLTWIFGQGGSVAIIARYGFNGLKKDMKHTHDAVGRVAVAVDKLDAKLDNLELIVNGHAVELAEIKAANSGRDAWVKSIQENCIRIHTRDWFPGDTGKGDGP